MPGANFSVFPQTKGPWQGDELATAMPSAQVRPAIRDLLEETNRATEQARETSVNGSSSVGSAASRVKGLQSRDLQLST